MTSKPNLQTPSRVGPSRSSTPHPDDLEVRDLPPFLRSDPPPVSVPSQARLDALYASTSAQRESNPTGYGVNATWWADVVQETLRNGWLNAPSAGPSGMQTPRKAVRSIQTPRKAGLGLGKGEDDEVRETNELGGDRLILSVDEKMSKRLAKVDGALPKGLGGVVEIESNKSPPTWHLLQAFLNSPTPLHAPDSLSYKLVGKPLWWMLSQLNPFGASGAVEKEETLWKRYGRGREYVCMPLLEETAAAFLTYIEDNPSLSYTASLFTPSTFRDEFGEICFPDNGNLPANKTHQLSLRDVEILLKWLSRDCGAVVMDEKVIKVLQADQIAGDHPITEADRGTIDIITTLKRIEEQIARIEVDIYECQVKAKAYLAKGQKNLAMAQLKTKKALEEVLNKRLGASEQLQTVLRSIDQAKSDVEVMQTYELSTTTLRSLLSHPSLDQEHITQTTDNLAEAIADQHEIDDAIRLGGDIATGSRTGEIDEDELAAELEGLIEEEKGKAEKEKEKKEERVEEKGAGPVAEDKSGERETRQAEEALLEKRAAAVGLIRRDSQRDTAVVPGVRDDGKPAEVASGRDTSDKDERAAEAEWKRRYEDAQQRQREERQRAEEERLRKEAARVPAG